MNYELAGAAYKLDYLQNLVFCEKARSASIFVAVCVSARLENTDLSLSSVAAHLF
ncbi:MAG: hypothetical protein LBH32_05105 [Dysgonamonadaceae bacterium]|jgi:hypothetical protein|nr:hypothetical protein [Dysgonamonadaceae bacterium]